ncbi:MAG: protein kinase [Planctomycetes bacterium]|nr:protein kinase [Planctomycetota bacterium]
MDDRKVFESYPLPLARGHRRFRNAGEARERHDAAYYLFEILLKYLASIAIARYLRGEERDHKVNAALKGLARPSLGEWLRFLRECLRFLGDSGARDPLVDAVGALCGERRGGRGSGAHSLGLYNALRSFRSEAPSAKEQASLDGVFSEVVAYRNRVLGHGAPLEAEHYRRFGELFQQAFLEILEEARFLTACRLVSFDSIQVREGSRVECGVIEHMGLHPLRREAPHVLPYGAPAPRTQALYLLGEGGDLLCLDPLLLAHREDVYFLNEAAAPLRGAETGVSLSLPEYLSYSSGERHRPSGLGEAQEEVFERILGYRVDEARLSRLGDDVALAAGGPAAEAPAGGEKRLRDYRILKEVGRGAMGIVFEAVHETLGRRVALKVLPGSFALDPRRVERFYREARATARVHDPHIVPVYDVGEAEGTHFYAMDFIEGPSLDRLIALARKEAEARKPRRGSSSDRTYLHAAVEEIAGVAEGLEKAHRLGLIHRDVKPSNILVEGGTALASTPEGGRTGRYVLLDFGLVHEVEAKTLTRSGEMVGTLGYMSPEQVSRGQVDGRSDVYSLGLVLYELLTLRAPFEGKSDHELPRAILFEEPPLPRRLNPRVSRDLETIVLHAMEKNPERRYATAGELASDLRRYLRGEPVRARPQSAWRRGLRRAWRHKARVALAAMALAVATLSGVLLWPKGTPSLAILPFAHPGGDQETEALCDGLLDSLIRSLGGPRLKVRPRSSVIGYKGRDQDPIKAGRDLGAGAVLTGVIQVKEGALAASFDLVDVRENSSLWSERFERRRDEILLLEREIAGKVAEALGLRLSGEDQRRLAKSYTKSTEAYRLYTLGRFFWNKRTDADFKTGIKHFEEAIAKDPGYALAYTGLADCYFSLGSSIEGGSLPPREGMARSKAEALKALEIDGGLAEAHASLALIYFHQDWAWARAEEELRRAIELDPDYAHAHHWYSHLLMALGRIPESLRESREALHAEPSNFILNVHLGWHHLYAGEHDQAIRALDLSIEINPDDYHGYWHRGLAYEQKGMLPKAIEDLERAVRLGGMNGPRAALGHAYALSRQGDKAQAALDEMVKASSSAGTYLSPYHLAVVHAGLGRVESALGLLQQACDERSDLLVYLNIDRSLTNLRAHPRFAELVERIGLPPGRPGVRRPKTPRGRPRGAPGIRAGARGWPPRGSRRTLPA